MKQLQYGKEARQSFLNGINKCADAVKVTFGLGGRFVMIRRIDGAFRPTKDGVSVSREVYLPNLNEDTGASLVRSASEKTVSQAGDGTTVTAVLTQALCNNGFNAVEAGANPVQLKKGMDAACNFIVEEIKKVAISAKNDKGVVNDEIVKQIAMISSNSDPEVGGIVADAIKEVGAEGMIAIENSSDDKTSLEKTEGVLASTGFHNQYFITDKAKNRAELENPYILLYDRKLDMFKPLQPILEQVLKQNASLLIFCAELENEALSTLVTNKIKGGMKVCVVKCPSFGVQKRLILEDLAAVVGGQFISEERGLKLERVQLNQLGRAKKVIIEKDRTMIIGGEGDVDKLATHLTVLLAQIDNTEDEKEKIALKERYAKLTGGVALIKVGGTTQQEVDEKKDRIDDAICASKAAIAEGIVAGGGSLYLKLIAGLDSIHSDDNDFNTGVNVVSKSLVSPITQILSNAGITISDEILNEVSKSENNIGYNLKTEKVEDLIQAGVIDPAKVLRVALENSVSVATMFLMTECSIAPIQN